MVQEAEPYAPQKAANCYWDGTSPFCAGSCNTNDNYIPCRTDPSGDGATCVTGYKKYCCQGSCPSARDIDGEFFLSRNRIPWHAETPSRLGNIDQNKSTSMTAFHYFSPS